MYILTQKQVERIYDLPRGYLSKVRNKGLGLRAYRIGSSYVYLSHEVSAWIDLTRHFVEDLNPAAMRKR